MDDKIDAPLGWVILTYGWHEDDSNRSFMIRVADIKLVGETDTGYGFVVLSDDSRIVLLESFSEAVEMISSASDSAG